MSELKTISIDNLFVDPQQSRTSSNARLDEDFKDSIKRHGVINPLTVREKETKSRETVDKKGTPEAPAGEQEYWIVAGRRRFLAAVEVGIPEIDCIVEEYDDEEAASVSLDENEHRVPLSQFELAQSVKKRYDVLSEDLVGENESVECPECGKECEGRESIKQHIAQASGHPRDESSYGFKFSNERILKKIAKDSSFDYKTVKRLISVASIPEQFQAFVKIPEERSSQEEDRVSNLISSGFTFANQERDSIVSQKTIDFARFVKDKPPRLVELTLDRCDFKRQDTTGTKQIFSRVTDTWSEWKEEDVADDIKYNNSIKGNLPEREVEVEDEDDEETAKDITENEKKEETEDVEDEVENKKEKDTTVGSNPQEPVTEEDSDDGWSSESVESDTTPTFTQPDKENVEDTSEEIKEESEEAEATPTTSVYISVGNNRENFTIEGEYTTDEINEAVNTATEAIREILGDEE